QRRLQLPDLGLAAFDHLFPLRIRWSERITPCSSKTIPFSRIRNQRKNPRFNQLWKRYYILISNIGREARRVERHVSGKCRAFRAIHALEAFEACVEGCLPPARETHQNNFLRIDAWMRGEHT